MGRDFVPLLREVANTDPFLLPADGPAIDGGDGDEFTQCGQMPDASCATSKEMNCVRPLIGDNPDNTYRGQNA